MVYTLYLAYTLYMPYKWYFFKPIARTFLTFFSGIPILIASADL